MIVLELTETEADMVLEALGGYAAFNSPFPSFRDDIETLANRIIDAVEAK